MANQFSFKPAVKREKKLRMFLTGASGAGKTYTALAVGTVLAKLSGGGLVAVLDSEASSAELYADRFDFVTAQIDAPYAPQKYIDGIRAAEQAGVAVLIIDSISHAWNGAGGLLEMVEQFSQTSTGKRGNAFTNGWSKATPIQQQMFETILRAPMHIIVTARTKTEYVLEKDDRGRDVPVKIGTAPVQRADVDYEFDVVLEMTHEHVGRVSKSRFASVADMIVPKPGANFAETLYAELQGEAKAKGEKHSTVAKPTAEEFAGMMAMGASFYGAEWGNEVQAKIADWASKGQVTQLVDLSRAEVEAVVDSLARKAALRDAHSKAEAVGNASASTASQAPDTPAKTASSHVPAESAPVA